MWNIPETLPTRYLDIKVFNPTLPVNPNGHWDVISGNRDVNRLTHIVLHHDAVAKNGVSRYTDIELLNIITNNHIRLTSSNKKGENFPYHIYIRNGNVYLCNPIEFRTYGARNNNDYTVHICVAGDYKNHDVLTDQDRHALHLAILIARGSMPKYVKTVGHDQLVATNCPGYSVEQVLSEMNQIDLEINMLNNPKTKVHRAYDVANQILYLYRMISDGVDGNGQPVNDGQKSWALAQLLKLEQLMKELKLIK